MIRWFKEYWSAYVQILLAIALVAWLFTWFICIGCCRGELIPCLWKVLFVDFVESCR